MPQLRHCIVHVLCNGSNHGRALFKHRVPAQHHLHLTIALVAPLRSFFIRERVPAAYFSLPGLKLFQQ
jgi:hypothetical protein